MTTPLQKRKREKTRGEREGISHAKAEFTVTLLHVCLIYLNTEFKDRRSGVWGSASESLTPFSSTPY